MKALLKFGRDMVLGCASTSKVPIPMVMKQTPDRTLSKERHVLMPARRALPAGGG